MAPGLSGDLGPRLQQNLGRMRRQARKELFLVLSAANCPGCERLDEQWRRPGVRRLLAGRTYVWKLVVGDLHDDPPRKVRLGNWSWEVPGFPTVLAFRLAEPGLQLLGCALGPFDDNDPAGGMAELLECRSQVVPEARGLAVTACTDTLCLRLDASNGWRLPLTMPA